MSNLCNICKSIKESIDEYNCNKCNEGIKTFLSCNIGYLFKIYDVATYPRTNYKDISVDKLIERYIYDVDMCRCCNHNYKFKKDNSCTTCLYKRYCYTCVDENISYNIGQKYEGVEHNTLLDAKRYKNTNYCLKHLKQVLI